MKGLFLDILYIFSAEKLEFEKDFKLGKSKNLK